MKLIFLFFFNLCSLFYAFSQQATVIDSLENQLEITDSKKELLEIYTQLFNHLSDTDSLKSFQYGVDAIAIAKELSEDSTAASIQYDLARSLLSWGNLEESENQLKSLLKFASDRTYERGLAVGYKGLGDLLRAQALYGDALEKYFISIQYWEKIEDKKGLGYCYNNIGVVYRNIANIPKALAYYLKALNILEEINDARGIGYISSNIGNIYYGQEDYSRAEDFHLKALKYNREINDLVGESYALNNLGLVINEVGRVQEAINYFKKSLKISDKINHKEGSLNAIINIGYSFLDVSEYDSAEKYFGQALSLSKEASDRQSESYALSGLGKIDFAKANFLKAKVFFEESMTIAEEIGYPNNVVHGAENLAKTEAQLGNYEAALASYMLFKKLSDSLKNEEQVEKLVRIQAESEFQQERDSLTLAQAHQQALYEKDIAVQSSRQLYLSLGLLLFGLIIIIIIFYNRKLQRLNKEVIQQRDELEKLNRTKSRFFSIIAHDLRGPMSIMTGYGDLIHYYLEKNYGVKEDAELDKIAGYLKDSSTQVLELLDSLLKWALKEESAIQLKPEPLDFWNCVRENFDILKHQALAKKIELVSESTENLTIRADKNSLMTILRNLTSNSLKFTPEGGKITISGTMEDERFIIKVTDTGVGISSEKMGTLFEIDEKKVSKGTKGEKGTGLGLNLVHDFVEMNNGKISVESEIDEGTTFIIVIDQS